MREFVSTQQLGFAPLLQSNTEINTASQLS